MKRQGRRFPPHTGRGFALPSAIFLLVILSLLGAFMLTLSNSMQISSAQDVQGARAFRAARAGIEWGAAKIQSTPGCPAASTDLAIDGFAVTVTCASNTYDEGGATKTIHWLGATASSGGPVGGLAFVERSLNAFVEF